MQLFEPLQPGSVTYTLSNMHVVVAAIHVAAIDINLDEVRSRNSLRLSAAPTTRYKISPLSLDKIKAAVPTYSDSWTVETIRQFRVMHGERQWLVKWMGYEEHRNTWEPWENLGETVQHEALEVQHASLPDNSPAVHKLNVAELKASLSLLQLDISGAKPVLAARLIDALSLA